MKTSVWLDPAILRDLAGAKVFARGQEYHRANRVTLLEYAAERVRARVQGGDVYSTRLMRRGKEIDGECDCPAFGDFGFCKHMVATALAANAAADSPAGIGKPNDVHRRMRSHLREMSINALIDIVMEAAEQDDALFQRLELASVSLTTDPDTIEQQLRSSIDRATSISDYVDYRQARKWAEGVEAALNAIAALTGTENATIALTLVLHAIQAIEAALSSIDDSSGYCSGLLQKAADIHLEATLKVRPNALDLARFLYARELDDDYGYFSDAASRYAEVLGDEGLAEYRRLALDAWNALPTLSRPKSGTRSLYSATSYEHGRLAEILDFFVERDSDVEARIALRRKDLSSTWKYLELAQFCLEIGRPQDALRYAEEGVWMFEDDPDSRLTFFAADLHKQHGNAAAASEILWKGFEAKPEMSLYERLRADETTRERAITLLRKRLGKAKSSRWNFPADLLISILTVENDFDAAWTTVDKHGASLGRIEQLARASERSHPRRAIGVYMECIGNLADSGGDPAYQEAVALIGHLRTLQTAEEHARFVSDVKKRHGRKRNLMKMLG